MAIGGVVSAALLGTLAVISGSGVIGCAFSHSHDDVDGSVPDGGGVDARGMDAGSVDAAGRPDGLSPDARVPIDGATADAVVAQDGSAQDGAPGSACDGGGDLNGCGGCTALEVEPGTTCPRCTLNTFVCDGTDATLCLDDPCEWTDVRAGHDHTCALRSDGMLWCWGDGWFGQRGDGTTELTVPHPRQVLAAGEAPGGTVWDDWTATTAGHGSTCALRTAGTLWCWGGTRGDGTDVVRRSTPAAVLQNNEEPGGNTWSDWSLAVSAGGHACGLREDGSLWCWGAGTWGQRGDGTFTDDRTTPTRVLAAGEEPGGAAWDDWVAVGGGDTYSCGLRSNGTMWCWGGTGSLRGDGTASENRATPAQVLAAGETAGGATWDDWVALTVGKRHACGLRQDGSLWCWGNGGYGQRGDGTTDTTTTAPVQVLAGGESPGGAAWTDWVAVEAGYRHTCGIRTDGSLWCWGGTDAGRLGSGFTFPAFQTTPSRVLAADAEPDGAFWSDWVRVEAGSMHTCALRADASLWCWGNGARGQLGTGTTPSSRLTPIQVLDP